MKGEEVTFESIAKELNMSPASFMLSFNSRQPSSLDEFVYNDDKHEITFDEIIASDDLNQIDIAVKRENRNELLTAIEKCLNRREKEIVYMYFYQNKAQVEIAKIFGVGQAQISKSLKKIYKKLRDSMGYPVKSIDIAAQNETDQHLSEREKVVLQMLDQNKTQTEIAAAIFLTQSRVSQIVKGINSKLERSELQDDRELF